MKHLLAAFSLVAGVLLAPVSHAATMHFEIGAGSAAFSSAPERLYVEVIDNSGLNFDLAPGDSYTFDFLKITCWHCDGSFQLDASLDFTSPVATASGTGGGWADNFWFLAWFTAGELNWQQPGTISTAAGSFSVFFEDLRGITLGKSVVVQATVTDIAPVPLPAAGWLFGSALLAFGARRWRRSTAT